jgi:DNA modification methylase
MRVEIGDAVLYCGDCREIIPTLERGSFRHACTSIPYWQLRDYGHPAQLGSEKTPEQFVAAMLEVFELVRAKIAPDGTLALNVGDSYAASGKGGGGSCASKRSASSWGGIIARKGFRMPPPGYKMKDLTLTPFALADALRRAGWYLRQTVIWRKSSAVEPTRADRPATSHEYLFLFAASERYFARHPSETWWNHSVWDIEREQYSDHPAVMPSELARRCILPFTEPGDAVLDPFAGSGTTLEVAVRLGRRAIGCELNPAYLEIAKRRMEEANGVGSLFDPTAAPTLFPSPG